MTQILKEASQEYTIVAIYPANDSQLALTKSGDMLFAGDNSTGGAGNGTTSNDGIEAGSTTLVVSSALPPSPAVTTNRISFEIEVKDSEGKTHYYTPVTDSNGNAVKTTSSNAASYTINGETGTSSAKNKMLYYLRSSKSSNGYDAICTLSLDAGTTFKLNVYFDDFGKINTFVMPIRFDPSRLQVVNGSGVAYSSSKLVCPGSYGTSVGIVQDFDTTDWNGGYLATGSTTESYPKISNGGGWVSIMGYSTSTNPEIKGNVEMFSINFRALTKFNDVAFDFATKTNAADSATEPTYDAASNGLSDGSCSAFWSIINTASDKTVSNGYFEFDHDPLPMFDTTLVLAKSITLTLTYGDNDSAVTQTNGTVDSTSTSWDLNWANKGVVYKMTAHLKGDTGKENVSYPYVNWTTSLAGGDGTKELTDYITIIEQTDTYIRFKINEDFEPETDASTGDTTEKEAAVVFKATYQSDSTKTSTDAARLKAMEAPKHIYIAQYDTSSKSYVPVADGDEMIYHYSYSDDKYETNARTFYVTYDDTYTGTSREVIWTLLDSDGNTVASSDADAKAVLSQDTTDTMYNGFMVPSVMVLPYSSTDGDDYLTLRCTSLYDSKVYDEVTVKVHLYVTKMEFSPKEICMPVSTDLATSSVKLAKYLGLEPLDAWATDYTWTAEWPSDSNAPGNWEKIYGEGATYDGTTQAVTYGQLNSTTGELIAYEYATPTDDPIIVTVEDNISHCTSTIKVKMMDVDSPIGINDFEAVNSLGYMNDTLTITDGLNPSGKTITSIELYQDYTDAVEGKASPFKTVTVSDDIRAKFTSDGYFTIAAYDNKKSLFDNAGGFIGVKITYTVGDDPTPITSDIVPVQYDQEPNVVDGYVRLFGRDVNSAQQAGIRIDLVGLNFKETVYTNADGYFKFTKYIAPGTYSMTISKTNYLTRYIQKDSKGNGGIAIPVNTDSDKFHISTSNDPIYLYPGELTNDNAITIQDITYYVSNWVGITDSTVSNFSLYDFIEDSVISSKDLELLLMRKDWTNESYPAWIVPDQ